MFWPSSEINFVIPCYFACVSDPQEPSKMTAMGVMKFLEDLSLDPEHRVVLIIAWKFQAANQCEFTKDEFINGMTDLGWVAYVSCTHNKVKICHC